MRWCNCGEALSASAQRNPAKTEIAINARPRFVERANLLIALRACYGAAYYARDFCKIASLGSACASRAGDDALVIADFSWLGKSVGVVTSEPRGACAPHFGKT